MATDKQTYNTEIYKKKLREAQEEYKKRKEYVSKFKLPMTEEEVEDVSTESTGSAVVDEGVSTGGGGDDGKGLISLAKTKMKAPYVFGAAGPSTFDCSGFICWIYNKCGYKFGRSTAAGYYSMFEKTSKPVPGDLIFFSNTYKAGVSHIGIWMGNNEFIHTANQRNGVQISQLTGYWKGKFTGYASPNKYFKGSTTEKKEKPKKSKAVQARMMVAAKEEEVIGDESTLPPIEDEGYFESKFTPKYNYIPVRFRGDSIYYSSDTREVFLHNRIGWVRNTKYKQLVHLNKKLFIHQNHYDGIEGNLYSPDAKKLFENLLLKTKKPYFEVISGFRFSNPGQLSPHEAGCAIDIRVESIDEVREIADCAWQLGVRSIAIGGDFTSNKGFIHIDIAPKGKDFMYDGVPIYGGPGKWVTQ
ncbi:C40 family peptidase [Gottfriedia acidiceleris]|uniref:NlpC/P60 family protein n=1 Tax=Gottfriedia acidiceleris TaxID=371036 RepID=UPI0033926D54